MTTTVKFLRSATIFATLFVVVNMTYTMSSFDIGAIGFIAWNIAPCVLAYMIISRPSAKHPAIGFVIGVLGLTILIHFYWMFDISGTKTGPSTSALIFIFIPIYSILLGLIAAAVGFGVSKLP